MKPYQTFRDEVTVVDGVAIKGKWVIIPIQSHQQALKQLYSNYMGIVNTRLLTSESINGMNTNADREYIKRSAQHGLDFNRWNQ